MIFFWQVYKSGKKRITINLEMVNRFYKENIIFLILEDKGELFIGKWLIEKFQRENSLETANRLLITTNR